jgi:hypothetical protein
MATVRLDQKGRALTRAIPSSFDQAIAKFFRHWANRFRSCQGATFAYREALLDAGVEVTGPTI